VDVKKVEA